MATGFEEAGFGLLGVPRPPDTTELERQVGVLESLGRSQASVAGEGARAYRLAGANTGAATDALAEHVTGQAGVLRRSTAQAQLASLGAGAARVAWNTVKWAGGILVGLAGMAGLAALTPQGRALIRPLLRPVAQRMQQWLLTATRFIGRIYTRLAERLRGTPAKPPAAHQRAAARPAAQPDTAVRWAAQQRAIAEAQARDSIRRAQSSIERAEAGRALARRHLGDAKMTLEVRLRGAYGRGEISESERAQLARRALADHPYLDEWMKQRLGQQAESLQRIDSQLGPVARHLDDAGRQVNDGLGVARANGLDTSDLQKLGYKVSDLNRRLYRLNNPPY
ncbi:hypothetical protein [Nonomuraea diastatica]|uniref:Uncharacterized protein n=1 Tax=Nonomuraea diastatica TaxID=1848329 RepID=A0A4R4VQS5_9ACTN|nr:hypothetical protein [Nonomuraea diastatica]TDD04655.1 hypothetical protein E1294_50015 [Nonomuraea diastatica]